MKRGSRKGEGIKKYRKRANYEGMTQKEFSKKLKEVHNKLCGKLPFASTTASSLGSNGKR